MGITYAEILLSNTGDIANFERGNIVESQVRTTSVNALVDTKTRTLVIKEEIREKLGLSIKGLRRSSLADSSKQVYKITEPVTIRWKDRETDCRAVVVPSAEEVLLGVIPLEDMDLTVNPVKQQLEGAHGDEPLLILKKLKEKDLL